MKTILKLHFSEVKARTRIHAQSSVFPPYVWGISPYRFWDRDFPPYRFWGRDFFTQISPSGGGISGVKSGRGISPLETGALERKFPIKIGLKMMKIS